MPMEQENTPTGLKGLFEVIKASCSAVVNAAAMLLENETLNRLNANQLAGLSKILETSVERLNRTVSRLQEEIQARQVKQEKKAAEQQQAEDPVIYAGEASEQAVKQAEREAAQTVEQSEKKETQTVEQPEKAAAQSAEKQSGNVADKGNKSGTDKQVDEAIPSEISEMLNKSLSQMSEPGRLRDFLETAARFPRYSVNNIMLIASQKPGASMLVGFKSWKNKYDVSVNRGEKGIRIMVPTVRKIKEERQKLDPQSGQPMMDSSGKPITEEVEIKKPIFKAVSVFDLSQTNGREKVVPEIDKFKVNQNDPAKLKRLKASILAAAKQELEKRGSTGREAEAVAYAVCSRYGINAQEYNIDSLQNEQELCKSLELIRDVTSELTQRLDEQQKRREQEQERQREDEQAQIQERERIEREKLEEKELQKKEQLTDAAVTAAFAAAVDVSLNQGDAKQQDRAWENGAETVGEKISAGSVVVEIPSAPRTEAQQKSKGGAPKQNTAARSAESTNRSSSSRSERKEGAYRVSEKDLGRRSVRERLKDNINRVNAEKNAQKQHGRGNREIDIG